jgi:alkylation response protein AidB-like acyl-CoA dehydrogenase
MDFSLTEAQRDLAALTRDIAGALSHERLRTVESGPDRFDRTLWTKLADSDLLGIGLPESVSGSGLGLLEQCSVLIELGRAVAPVPYVAAITQAASAVARFGDGKQRETWAVPSVSGDAVLTAALAEETGDDPATPATRARRDGDDWRLTGTKTVVPAGGFADLFLVPASTADGLTVFLVTPSDVGVTVERQRIVDLDSEAVVELADVTLGPDRVLGTVGGGGEIVDWLVTQGTIGLCALQLGVAERALELTTEYARTRVQFDRPIGSFQAVAGRLADAYIDVEAIRLTLWQAAWRVAEGLPAATEVATAKFWAAEAGHRVAHTAVHVHGGMGIDLDHPLHRYFVAAKRIEFTLGGATVQLRRIGDALAEVPA